MTPTDLSLEQIEQLCEDMEEYSQEMAYHAAEYISTDDREIRREQYIIYHRLDSAFRASQKELSKLYPIYSYLMDDSLKQRVETNLAK